MSRFLKILSYITGILFILIYCGLSFIDDKNYIYIPIFISIIMFLIVSNYIEKHKVAFDTENINLCNITFIFSNIIFLIFFIKSLLCEADYEYHMIANKYIIIVYVLLIIYLLLLKKTNHKVVKKIKK